MELFIYDLILTGLVIVAILMVTLAGIVHLLPFSFTVFALFVLSPVLVAGWRMIDID